MLVVGLGNKRNSRVQFGPAISTHEIRSLISKQQTASIGALAPELYVCCFWWVLIKINNTAASAFIEVKKHVAQSQQAYKPLSPCKTCRCFFPAPSTFHLRGFLDPFGTAHSQEFMLITYVPGHCLGLVPGFPACLGSARQCEFCEQTGAFQPSTLYERE